MLIYEKNDLIPGALDEAEEINCNIISINSVACIWILVLSLLAGDCANYSRENEPGNCFSFLGVSFDCHTRMHSVDADLLYCNDCKRI
jgi:hypothetical protein